MGRSRRKSKKSRPKVRVGLPKKNPRVFKPAFNIPPKLRSLLGVPQNDAEEDPKILSHWDHKASVIHNYKSFGFVSNPNLLGVRSRTPHIVQTHDLQLPPPPSDQPADEFHPFDSGSDLEEDDLKSALGKKRRDGQKKEKPLTAMQRLHVSRLIEKHGDNYQAMFMDMKLNAMQHSLATLENLCKRYYLYKDKNPLLILPS